MTQEHSQEHFSFVTIAGKDGVSFLQRILSADMKPLLSSRAVWSDLLSPVGRILFTFLVIPIGKGLWLQLPKNDVENLKNTLHKMRADEALRIETHHQMATTFLKAHRMPSAKELGIVKRIERAVYLVDPRTPELGCRAIHLQHEQIPKSLLRDHDVMSLADYQFLAYKFGIVEQARFVDMRPFLPVEIGHQHYQAISFNKGCFIGQEVNARIHLKGKTKRYLHGAYSTKNPFKDKSFPYELQSVDSQPKIRIIGGIVHATGEWSGLVLVEGSTISPTSLNISGQSILLTSRFAP